MAKIKNIDEFFNIILASIKLYIINNAKIEDKWKNLNDSIVEILQAEKKLRRFFVNRKVLSNDAVSIANELDAVFVRSEQTFRLFSQDDIFETKESLFNNTMNLINLIADNQAICDEFLEKYFSALPKTKIDFKYCLEWFQEIYGDVRQKNYQEANQEWERKNKNFTFTTDFWQLFKYLFACLEQLMIEDNSHKNHLFFDELKVNFPILNNEMLLDFTLNYCDRNTTIFESQTLAVNENNLLAIVSVDNIFKQHVNLFPSIKLIAEMRNLLEHRSNSFNLDFSIVTYEFISYITNNLVFMVLIAILSVSNLLDIGKIAK